MAQAYAPKGASKTLDVITLVPIIYLAGGANITMDACKIPSAAYAVDQKDFSAKLLFNFIQLTNTPSLTVQVKVDGQLRKEQTYTTPGSKEDFVFPIAPGESYVINLKNDGVIPDELELRCSRTLIINSKAKSCLC